MRERIARTYRWFVNRLPEALLLLFLLSLTPLVYLLARRAVHLWGIVSASPSSSLRAMTSDWWPLVAALLCLGGTAAIVVLVWRSRSLIWAVARKMIIEAMHRKAVVVLLVFFLVLMPSLPFLLKTEGTLKSQVQIVFTYALTLAEVLLCLLAIFVATASICSEVEGRQVHITDTKPLIRWQFLAGKLLGIVVVCAALLFLMAGVAYVLVAYMAREQDYASLTEWEVRQQEDRRREVLDEVFVARSSVKLPPPNVTEEELKAEIDRLRKEGRMETEEPEAAAWAAAAQLLVRRKLSIPPKYERRWVLSGLRPVSRGKREWIYLRFKLLCPGATGGDLMMGQWVAFVEAAGSSEEEDEKKSMTAVPLHAPGKRWKSNAYQELKAPASFVTRDGALHLGYANLEQDRTVSLAVPDGLEVLQKTESFFPNYYRSLTVILFHIVFLAALGLMAGSVFSFPVASLLAVFVFFLGVAGPWFMMLTQSVSMSFYMESRPQLSYLINALFNAFMGLVFAVVPHFGKYSPISDLVNGKMVSWGFVSQVGAVMVFIKGAIVTLLGVFLYSRRELARIIA